MTEAELARQAALRAWDRNMGRDREPRTEAGRRLVDDWRHGRFTNPTEDIRAIEAEAAAVDPPRHIAWCDDCGEYVGHVFPQTMGAYRLVDKAAAGPRDAGLDVDRLSEALHRVDPSRTDGGGHTPMCEDRAALIAAEYATGPRDAVTLYERRAVLDRALEDLAVTIPETMRKDFARLRAIVARLF